MASEAHVAGVEVVWDGRYQRQRCSWCGKTLIDYDLQRVAVLLPEDGSDPTPPAVWPVGAIVRTDGGFSTVVIEPAEGDIKVAELAPDACFLLDPAVTA